MKGTPPNMIDHFPLPIQGKPERRHLYVWIKEEERYVREKYDDGRQQRETHDEAMATRDLEAFWTRQILQYLDRAAAFLKDAQVADNDLKRERLEKLAQQALAKGFMTFKGCVESSIRVFGPMPKPGVSSGEILHWFDPVYHAATHEEE